MKKKWIRLLAFSFLLISCSPVGKVDLLKEVKENQVSNIEKNIWLVETIRFNQAKVEIKNIFNKSNTNRYKPLMYLSYKVNDKNIQYAFLVQNDNREEKIVVLTQDIENKVSIEEVERNEIQKYLGKEKE